jgi:putative aminopeptidase FrvX
MTLPEIRFERLQSFLTGLLNTASPTGMAEDALEYTRAAVESLPVEISLTRKGGLLVKMYGEQNDHPRALAGHVDTLGAMVKEIKSDGRLKLFQVGGYAWNTIEGEGCTVLAASGQRIRGSILLHRASAHVYGKDVSETKRDEESMEVRLDAVVNNPAETEALGIRVGDFVAFDPRVEWNNGFIRSRHLDDKAGVACLVEALHCLCEHSLKPAQTTWFFISNFEEVGHGASSGIPAEVEELVAVDMAAVGDGQNSDEFHTTICLSDSTGPYHRGLSNRLIALAQANQIPFKTDIYPHYGSDGSAFLRAGGSAAVALIGPGVDASHNYERSHTDSLLATTRLILAYMLKE